MLSIKINNPEIENKFYEYAKSQKKAIEEVAAEAIKYFIETHKQEPQLSYTKKDPLKHLNKIQYEDDGEDLSDVSLYKHIENSAEYVHNFRREKNR